MSNGYGTIKVFATNSGRTIASLICKKLSIPLGKARVKKFKDGEVDVQILENVRDHDVYIVVSLHPEADNFFEAIWLASAAKQSSAARVSYVITYMGYARADRKSAGRTPVGIRLAFEMLSVAKPDRMIILDIHAEQSLSLVPNAIVDHLFASIVLVPVLKESLQSNVFVVASPDKGGAVRAMAYAKFLGKDDFVILSKSRPKPGEVDEDSIMIIGEVKDRTVVFVDDMIDTGGSMIAGAKAVMKAGATGVVVCVTHALFSDHARKKFQECDAIQAVYVTDSVNSLLPETLQDYSKINTVTVSGLLASAIRRTHDGQSLSELIISM